VFLLSVLQASVTLLLIARPLPEEVGHHHQNFMSDGQRRFRSPDAPLETPIRGAREGQEGVRAAPAHGTNTERKEWFRWRERPERRLRARASSPDTARPKRRAEPPTQRGVSPCRSRPGLPELCSLNSREPGARLHLRRQGCAERAEMLVQLGTLPVTPIDALQWPLHEPSMMGGTRPGARELRAFPPQDIEGQRRQHVGGALPRPECGEQPAPAAAEPIGDDTRARAMGIPTHVDTPVVRLRPGLDQGHPRVRQMPSRTNGGRRDKARTDEAMRQELCNLA
jgi:hypothetical protein